MNVFVDTNILLDVLARREPFYADSAEVWTLAETGRITAVTESAPLTLKDTVPEVHANKSLTAAARKYKNSRG